MGDGGPAIARAVPVCHAGDRVQGEADTGVADRVDVDLEAEFVDGDQSGGVLLGCPVGHSVRSRAVGAGLEQGGGAGFDDPVGVELDGAGREALACLGFDACAVGLEGVEVRPQPQPTGGRRVEPHRHVGGLDHGVVHPGDSGGRYPVRRVDQGIDLLLVRWLRLPGENRLDGALFAQRAQRGAVVTPDDLAAVGIGGGGVVPRPAQGLAVHPQRVVIIVRSDRTTGDDGVEPSRPDRPPGAIDGSNAFPVIHSSSG